MNVNIILDNNRNILGLYDKNSLAFVELMDIIINELNIICRIMNNGISIRDVNIIGDSYRIVSMKMNSNVIYQEYFFSLLTFSFFNNNKEVVEFFDEYNFSIMKKKYEIKCLYNQIINKNNFDNKKSLDVFIPIEKMDSDVYINNNIDTEFVNNNIINSDDNKLSKEISKEEVLKKIKNLEHNINEEDQKIKLIKKRK